MGIIGIIGMKISLGQNLLLVPFCYYYSIRIIEMKIFLRQIYCLLLFGYDSKKLGKNVLLRVCI